MGMSKELQVIVETQMIVETKIVVETQWKEEAKQKKQDLWSEKLLEESRMSMSLER